MAYDTILYEVRERICTHHPEPSRTHEFLQ